MEGAYNRAIRQCDILDKLLASPRNFPALKNLSLYVFLNVVGAEEGNFRKYAKRFEKLAGGAQEQCFKELGGIPGAHVAFTFESSIQLWGLGTS